MTPSTSSGRSPAEILRAEAAKRILVKDGAYGTAILTVVMRAPTDADTLRKNPLGVYVDAVDWSRELDPPVQARPTPPPAAPPPVPAGLPLGSPLDPNLPAPKQHAQESRP